MLKLQKLLIASLVCAAASQAAPSAHAGPLYDWLWQHHYNKLMRCAPRSYAAPVAQACPQPGCCTTTCTQTCQRVVVNYVPYTAYRTDWEQVPVTSYQPTTSADPCTGCSVTCMKPCTSYSWQMKRVPYTTYRPVYRTESYSVPVTYSTPAPTACNTCPTCPTYPTAAAPQVGCSTCGPTYAAPTVTGLPPTTLTTNGGYTVIPGTVGPSSYYQTPTTLPAETGVPQNSTLAPADQVPVLGKPIIIDRREITPSSSSFQAPALNPSNTGTQNIRPIQDPNPGMRWDNRDPAPHVEDQTASAPTRQRFDYSPVRLASHTQTVLDSVQSGPRTYRGELQIAPAAPRVEQVNTAWKNAN